MKKEYININSAQRVVESKPRMLLGILGDKDSERVWFKSDKIVGDDVDLSKLQLYIKYAACDKRASKYIKETQIYHCEDVQDCGDYITFSWLMSGNVFSESGFVAYSVLAANGNEVRWNTYPAVGTVGMTVPGGLEEIAEECQDVITQLFERLEQVEKINVPEELVKETVTEYLREHPIDVPVSSVNGKTGDVELTAEDIGALPNTTQIPTKMSDLRDDKGYLTEHQDISNLAPKATTLAGYGITDGAKKTDIPKMASDVGAEPAGTARTEIKAHDTSGTAHDDIRELIKKLEPKIPSLLSELTDDAEHRTVTDSEKEKWNSKSDFSGSYNDLSNKPEIPTKLPNPHKLTFGGAVQAVYDGSGAVEVIIPNGQSATGQATARVEKDAADTDATIEPNKLYIFPEMTMLNIALANIQDASVVSEYHFVFESGATATTFALPDNIKTPDGFGIDANKIYEISIMEGCLAYQSWAVS